MAEVYEMMMKLGLEGSAMAGVANIASVLSSMHKKVGEIEKGFSNWKTALVGVGSIIGGALILGGIEKVIEKTKGLSDELAKLEKLGGPMSSSVISGEMTARAFDISKRVGMNVVDLLKIPGQMYSMIGKEESDKIWEPLAKYAFSQRSDAGFTASSENKLQSLVRAGEAMGRLTDAATGQIDPAKLEHWLDLAQQIKSATHGTVNEEVLLGMAKQLGPAGRAMTDEGMMSLAVAAQVLGGQRTGTAIMSTWQQLAAGTMLKRSALGLEAVGMLKPSEWEIVKGSAAVVLHDDASKRLTNLISHDPLELARQMRENLINMGITDQAEQMRMIMRAMGRATTQRFTAEEVANYEQIMSEKGRMGAGYGAGQSFDTSMNKSISANEEALKQAWENLQFAVAGPQSENVIKVLKSLTEFINSMTGSIREMNPDTIRNIGTGIAALGAGLIGAGSVALLAALGPAGWLVGGIIALGTAFANNAFGIRTGMATMEAAIVSLAKSEWAHIVNGFNTIRDAIASFFSFLSGFKWSGNPFAAKADPLITGTPQKKGWEDWPGLSHSGGMSPIPFHKSSYEGDMLGGARIIPANFNPGQKKQVLQPITLSLNLDGRTLGQAVSEVLEDLYTHPTGPPQANGWDHFRPQGNFSDT